MKKYKPRKEPYIEKREKLLTNSKNFYDGRETIIDPFKNKIFSTSPTDFSEDDKSSEGRDDRQSTMEDEKLDIATVGKDMPLSETEEEAEKRQKMP